MSFVYVLRNSAYMFVANVVTRLLSFVFFLLIARLLGAEGLGHYSFVFAFVGLFSLLSDVGIASLFVREGSRSEKVIESLFSYVAPLRLVLVVVTFLVTAIAALFADVEPQVVLATQLAAFGFMFLSLRELLVSIFQARQRILFIAIVQLVEITVTVSVGAAALLSGQGLVGVVGAYVAAYVISFLVSFVGAFKTTRLRLSFDIPRQVSFLRSALPFWFTSLFMAFAFRIDTVMIELLRGSVETGLYNASFRLLDALYFIPASIITALFPAMSQLHVTDRKSLLYLYQKAFYYLFAIALPMGVGTTLLAGRFIMFLFGGSFAPSARALQLLIWAEVAIFLFSVTGFLLNAIGRQLQFTIATALASLLNVFLNFFFIQWLGFIGAAITTVVTQSFILFVLLVVARREGYTAPSFSLLVKPAVAALVMGGVIVFIDVLHIFFIVPIAAAVYVAVLFVLGGIQKEEVALIKSRLP